MLARPLFDARQRGLAASQPIGVALFACAYMAGAPRGGLQALPKGQSEAAQALDLRFWARQRLVILPQALRLVIPAIANGKTRDR